MQKLAVCTMSAGLLLLAAVCSRPSRVGLDATPPSHFHSPGDLVLADSAEVRPTNGRRIPHYPRQLLAAKTEARFVAVFVVNTAGQVEYQSISFVPTVAPAFRAAVCSVLRDTRWTPVMRAGSRRRALVLQGFAFGFSGDRWVDHAYDAEVVRWAISMVGVEQATQHLAMQAHC